MSQFDRLLSDMREMISGKGKARSIVTIVASVCLVTAAIAAEQHRHSYGDAAAAAPRSAFDGAMAQAMQRMDAGMAVVHSGNVDRDFAAMMIPHHQGAIDMAKAELLYGHDVALRRLAEGIIVEQQQEIELMQRRLRELSNASVQPGDGRIRPRD